jgi:hypothetical protein
LEKHLDLAWSELNQKRLQREVGPVNFSKIQEILSFVSNQDAWLTAPNLSSAGDRVHAMLNRQYPWLSPNASFRLVNHATYGWR